MHLILLHGAISSKEQFNFLLPHLEKYEVHALNFAGHGGSDLLETFSIQLFAEQVLDYIENNIAVDENGGKLVDVFGYSMGGYVAMYLARHHSENVRKIITLATKFNWDEETAARETKMLNPETIEAKIPTFAKKLADDHQPADWKEVLNKTSAMLQQMGVDNPLKLYDYNSIRNDCMLMLGDRDKMVSINETAAVYNQLPQAQLCVLPQTSHRLEDAEPGFISFIVNRFLSA